MSAGDARDWQPTGGRLARLRETARLRVAETRLPHLARTLERSPRELTRLLSRASPPRRKRKDREKRIKRGAGALLIVKSALRGLPGHAQAGAFHTFLSTLEAQFRAAETPLPEWLLLSLQQAENTEGDAERERV